MFQDTAVGIAFVDTFYDCLDKCQEQADCNWISYKDNGACYEYEKCTEKDPEAVDFQTTQIDCSSIGKLAYYRCLFFRPTHFFIFIIYDQLVCRYVLTFGTLLTAS